MSLYLNKVKSWFSDAININPNVETELKRALERHQKTPAFIYNLAKEFESVQDLRLKQGKNIFDEATLRSFTYDYADWFARLAKKAKDEEYTSQLAKLVAQQKMQEKKDLESTLDGNPQGIYSEIEMTVLKEGEEDYGPPKSTN